MWVSIASLYSIFICLREEIVQYFINAFDEENHAHIVPIIIGLNICVVELYTSTIHTLCCVQISFFMYIVSV